MTKDLENDKWIKVYFSLSSHASGIIRAKKEMISYAEELGWEIDIDKKGHIDEEGERMFEMKISPKGGKCSPEELRQKRDLIDGFAISIVRDILHGGNVEEMPENVYFE